MKLANLGQHVPLGRARRDPSEMALIALEAFTGLSAVAGGVLLMARPDGSLLQVAPSALSALARDSPFSDFFLPGLLLAVVGGALALHGAIHFLGFVVDWERLQHEADR